MVDPVAKDALVSVTDTRASLAAGLTHLLYMCII